MKYKKLHLYTFIENMKIIPYIFLIPIFMQFIIKSISIWILILSYILCILLSSIIIFFNFYNYINKEIAQFNGKIILKSGIFTKIKNRIILKNICSIIVEQNILNKFTRSYKTFIILYKTNNIIKNGLYLTKKQVNDIKNSFIKNQNFVPLYKISLSDLTILSFSYYNIIYAIFVAIPTVKKIQTIIDNNFTQKYGSVILNNFKFSSLNLITSKILSFLILFIFLIFLSKVIKFWNLEVKRSKNMIYIKQGLFNSHLSIINQKNISAISYQETILSIILNVKFMCIHTIKSKNTHGKFLVSILKKNSDFKLNNFLSKRSGEKFLEITPNKKSLINYIAFPISIGLILFTVANFIPFHKIKPIFITLIAVFTIYYLFIRIYAFKKSKITLYENMLTASSFKGLSIYNVVIPINNTRTIKIKQSPLQILSKKCTFYIYSLSNAEKIFKIKHLNVYNVENLVETLENSILK